MSSVAISGNASGTGVLTIAAPNTNSSYTLTLPTQTSTLMANGPAFSAYQSSGQVIGASVATKIQFQTEVFDTATAFDSTTNYRFTPLVAGYYQATGAIYFGAAAQGNQLYIYKNGSNYQNNAYIVANGSTMTGLVYLNGSTDYLELWCYLVSGSTLSGTSQNTYFQATMVRGA